MTFEYKVVPAPTRGRKARGVKTPADRFAHALEEVMNDLAEEGWEYLRTDTLPAEERQGLTGRTTVYQNMLVFRRAVETGDDAPAATVPAPGPTVAAPRVDRLAGNPPGRDPDEAPDPEPDTNPGTGPDTPPAPAPDTTPSKTLDTMIAQELAAVTRTPRLPSAGAAQRDPGTPVKAQTVGTAKPGLAAE